MSFERLKAAVSNPRPALEAVGLYMVGKAQAAFRNQGVQGESWQPRSVPNKLGVLADLNAGRAPPERRWDDRPAATDTGRLRQSIAYRVTGSNTVTVGSNLEYASEVQQGGTRTQPVPRTALAAWLRSLTGDRKRRAHRAFGFLFHLSQLTVQVPARPFLRVTDEDRKKFGELARGVIVGRN